MKLEERINYNCTGIYKLECLVTHEVYIGQAKNINKRIYSHLHSVINQNRKDYNYPIHKALRKYGIDNFDFSVLEVCEYSQLNDKEITWITFYDSYYNGYNQTKGGKQNIRHIKLTEFEVKEIWQLLKLSKLSNKEIADKFCITADFVGNINDGTAWHDNKIVYPIRVYKDSDAAKVYNRHYNGTCICQYTKDYQLVAKYTGYSEIEKNLQIKGVESHISPCTKGKRKTAYGYIWKREPISELEFEKLVLKV